MKKEYASEGHDLTNPAPFKNLRIPLPEKLETDADFTQLFHWMISNFHLSINAYGKRFGYADRQRLLIYILNTFLNPLSRSNERATKKRTIQTVAFA